jgi:hypothetical protein
MIPRNSAEFVGVDEHLRFPSAERRLSLTKLNRAKDRPFGGSRTPGISLRCGQPERDKTIEKRGVGLERRLAERDQGFVTADKKARRFWGRRRLRYDQKHDYRQVNDHGAPNELV